MYKGISLSASLMCIVWLHAIKDLQELEKGNIDYLHIDIIDGIFAPDFSMGTSIINRLLANTILPSDYHLMVEEPARLFNTFLTKKSDIYTIHQECCRNLHRDLVKIRQMGMRVGVAISPGTPLEALEYVIEDVDVIVIMSVDPGYKGQPLVPQSIRKVEKLKNIIDKTGLKVQISVDGCVHQKTIPEMVSAGADILVLGSSGLFRKDMSIKDAIGTIHEAIDKGKGS